MSTGQPTRLRIRPARPSAHAREIVLDGTVNEFVIGRGAGALVELPFAVVSLRHARCYRSAGIWCIEDLGSVNGTWRGTRRLVPGKPEPLVPGEILRLGDVGLELLEPATKAGYVPDAGTNTLARQLVSDLFGSLPAQEGEVPTLEVVGGPDRGRRFVLTERGRPYRLGRDPDCDFVLSDPDCSRKHAALIRREDGIHIVDLRAKNGVLVEGARVVGEALLRDRQEIVLGATRLRLDDPEARYLERMRAEEAPLVAAESQRAELLEMALRQASAVATPGNETPVAEPAQAKVSAPAQTPPVVVAPTTATPASVGWLVVLSLAVLVGLVVFAVWLFV